MALDVTIIEGAPLTGKTTRLAEEVRDALREGADPADVLVLAASPVAAQELQRRLAALGVSVAVTVPRARFLELLADEEARAVTGRGARLLLPFEYDIFLEDLKTSGLKPRRLREMLKFFYRGMADGESADEGWLITNEERELMALLNDTLAFQGAMLEAEVASLALRALHEGATLGERAKTPLVFVDDYPLLSRATQEALTLIAGERLTVAGGEGGVEAFEAYSNAEGLAELVDSFPTARRVTLEAPGFSAGCAEGEAAMAAAPAEEMGAVARLVQEALDNGCAPADIVVAAEHPAWRRAVVRSLDALGVPATEVPGAGFLRCDVRRAEGATAARLATAVALVADPADGVAWRAWCGFGDYLANSNGMRSLCQRGRNRGLAAVLGAGELQPDLLDGLDAMGSIRRIEIAYQTGRGLLSRLEGLEGAALLRAALNEMGLPDESVPPALMAAMLPGGAEDESAAAMIARLREMAAFPVFGETDAVRVSSFKATCGLAPRLLVIAGAMNGFFPKADFFDATALTVEQQQRRAEKAQREAAALKARASERVAMTATAQLPLEDAERLGVVVERIAFANGRRLAKTEPSLYLTSVLDAR